jgi:hypothetical protein
VGTGAHPTVDESRSFVAVARQMQMQGKLILLYLIKTGASTLHHHTIQARGGPLRCYMLQAWQPSSVQISNETFITSVEQITLELEKKPNPPTQKNSTTNQKFILKIFLNPHCLKACIICRSFFNT